MFYLYLWCHCQQDNGNKLKSLSWISIAWFNSLKSLLLTPFYPILHHPRTVHLCIHHLQELYLMSHMEEPNRTEIYGIRSLLGLKWSMTHHISTLANHVQTGKYFPKTFVNFSQLITHISIFKMKDFTLNNKISQGNLLYQVQQTYIWVNILSHPVKINKFSK